MSQAQETKREARAALAAEKQAEQEHEAQLQRQILDWVTVMQPKRGDVIVMTVPREYFAMPGMAEEDITDEMKAMMETCHGVLRALVENIHRSGTLVGGAAVIAEGMTLEDLPPPWEQHPDSKDSGSRVVRPNSRIHLPPGTKI